MMQRRQASTWLPEALSSFSVWGGSGWVLKTLHMEGALPYWACFIAINVLVRVCLVPLVLHGAHTAGRFAKVVPEVQFLVSLFSNDMKQMQQRKASVVERWSLMRTNLQSLGGIYKLHNINPFAVFLSPLMQLPIFWYVVS
jgi:membrane protein insertase Oxa1/YidC/SpoIIIJ